MTARRWGPVLTRQPHRAHARTTRNDFPVELSPPTSDSRYLDSIFHIKYTISSRIEEAALIQSHSHTIRICRPGNRSCGKVFISLSLSSYVSSLMVTPFRRRRSSASFLRCQAVWNKDSIFTDSGIFLSTVWPRASLKKWSSRKQ